MFHPETALLRIANRPGSLTAFALWCCLILPACSDQKVRSPAQGVQGTPAPDGAGPAPRNTDPGSAGSGSPGTGKKVQVWVELMDAPLAVANGPGSKGGVSLLSTSQQREYVRQCEAHENALMTQIQNLGGRELGRVSKALVAVAVSIEPSKIGALAALPNVHRVMPVVDAQLDLQDTVPHIGAAALQAEGILGTSVRVAVLDTGIDYTHAFLGGPGTAEAYTAAYGTSTTDPRNTLPNAFFPSAKVVGGYDFVGEAWPNGPLAPDPNPIDCGPAAIPAPCAGGHGSHVSDIIAGNNGGTHKGVAPGAKLYAVKVCSSVSSSCSGVALLQGIDFALDPDGHGDVANPVDVINMSLGESYGQKESALSIASSNAVRLGVIVVVSAGNSGDRPYIVGSPSTAPEIISVAQTTVPSDKLFRIRAGAVAPVGGVHQPWSADAVLTSGRQGYDTTNSGTRLGCSDAAGTNPYAAGSHTGEILLMDRGVCAVSLKVSNASAAGAVAAIVANNLPQPPGELPPSFSFGGGTANIPAYTVTQADGVILQGVAALGQTTSIDPSDAASLVNHMVSTSARGPSYSYNTIKPDIGAPGASVSAVAGSGTLDEAFGGTSGAAPMVTGSVALLLERYAERPSFEIKSVLMNTAETQIFLNTVALPGVLAPITRIGGGEVRVDKAFHSMTAAWDADDLTGSLSFGYHAMMIAPRSFRRSVEVRNYSDNDKTYSVTSSFRSANQAALGAVTLDMPASITVPAHRKRTFDVNMTVEGCKLREWTLNGGSRGGDGFRLQEFDGDGPFEFDGYIRITDGTDNVHLAWQVLPHKAADVKADRDDVTLSGGSASVTLSNTQGATDGRVDVFSLVTGTEEQGTIFPFIKLKSVGVRQVGDNIQFAFNTFGERAHPNYPAQFQIAIQDAGGADAFLIFNRENGAFGTTGQNVVSVVDVATGQETIYFFADADLDSANAILTAPLGALGLTPNTQFHFSVFAIDNYFTNNLVSHAFRDMAYTPGIPRFSGSGIPSTGVPPQGSSTLSIQAVPGGDVASPSQIGLLLMYRDAAPASEAEAITVRP